MTIRAKPDSEYLSADIIKRADELFDEAEKLADSEDVLARVRGARLPIQYVRISTSPPDDPRRAQIVEKFFKVVEKPPKKDHQKNKWDSLFKDES